MKERKYPVLIKEKGHIARIYNRRPAKDCFRVTWQQAGKQVTRERTSFQDAEKLARDAVKTLARGESAVLSSKEINDLLIANNALRGTGVSLVDAITEFVIAKKIVPNETLSIVAKAWRDNHTSINRVPFAQVAAEFLAQQKASVSARTYREDEYRIKRFQDSFKVDMCDLSKAAVDFFFEQEMKGLASKTKNHFRQTLRQILKLAVRKDYISKDHRLAESLENGRTHEAAPEILKPAELSKLLKAASPELLPFIAIGAFAGLRREEILRLTWDDVRRTKGDEEHSDGYIEVCADKAKTRQRRLVPIQPALAAWLAPYCKRKGLIWQSTGPAQDKAFSKLKKDCGVSGRNLLRHSYASYRLASTTNAALVALELGNSQGKLFRNYNKLVIPKAAKEWFAILPKDPANIITPARAVA